MYEDISGGGGGFVYWCQRPNPLGNIGPTSEQYFSYIHA